MKFISAIGSALTNGLKSLGRCALAPIKFLFGGGGGGRLDAPVPQVSSIEEEMSAEAVERERQITTALVLANVVMRYAATSIVDDAPAHLPQELTPELKQWCRGLSRDECQTIVDADEKTVLSHIQRLFPLPDVRKIGLLPTAQWHKEASPEYDDGSRLQCRRLRAIAKGPAARKRSFSIRSARFVSSRVRLRSISRRCRLSR